MKLSLIIPVFNEARHLNAFLKRIDEAPLPLDRELVIVDDCSTDGSTEILKAYPFTSKVILHHQAVNQGKGTATHVGIDLATGDIIGVQDADFEYDPKDIQALVTPLVEDRADVVYGSRFRMNGTQVHRTYHYLVNRILTILSNLSSGLYLTDMETCYKFFRRDVITNIVLESQRFGFEPEITAKIARLRLRVHEVPISYFPRNYLQGKKITWKDGVAALRHILYYNFWADPKHFLKPTLPERYLSNGEHWL